MTPVFFWIASIVAIVAGFALLLWALLSGPTFDEVDDRESLFDNWGM